MRLLLSGGGDAERVVHLDLFFVNQIDLQSTVLYVPVACEDDPVYARCWDWFKRTYKPYGIKNMEMCADLSGAPDLSGYAAVFIGGGNTYKLLKEIRASGFDKKLMDYLNGGGFVYGGSAGSIIFGSDIRPTTYEDENSVGLEDSSGLNMVNGCNICCHYGNGGEENTQYKRDRIKEGGTMFTTTIALPENCGIYVEDVYSC